MKKISLSLAMIALSFSALTAQNLNVTFRAKMNFPGQTLANVWGYSAGGHEYALIGASKGLVIADITDPDNPQQIVQIPGPNNLWKEIKTYGHYAYIVSEGGQGIQVVDLRKLPSPNLDYHFYTGDGPIQGILGKIHALHIDTTKGYLYAYGGNLFSGGAKVFNLNPDPYNPVYAGKFDQLSYIHDGYVDNDTMYGAHIYSGLFSVVNMADKSNPQLITSQNTPNNFTHNTWLSNDRKTLLTTDEVNNSFLAAFDISDLNNIHLLDKIQSNQGSNSMVHNTHILNNFAITSWYKDGFTIVDITRPDNLVQVGNFDVYPGGSGGGSDGCWGVYPFFPSGTIIASVISAPGTTGGELWVLSPQYVRACYLEGKIINGTTGNPLNGVQIEVIGAAPSNTASTLPDGTFKLGQAQEGYFIVRVSKAGFQAQEYTVFFQRADVRTLNIALYPIGGLTVNGQVLSASGGAPVPNATVSFSSFSGGWETTTDGAGYFTMNNLPPGIYDIAAAAPGYGQTAKFHYKILENKTLTLRLSLDSKSLIPNDTGSKIRASAWPNPFFDQVNLRLEPAGAGTVLYISDLTGRVIRRIDLEEGSETLEIGSDLKPGVYLLRLQQNNDILQVLRLVKLP